jgi:hypothetical protein
MIATYGADCRWQHVLPYGEVKLDMTARLSIRTTAPSTPRASSDTAP